MRFAIDPDENLVEMPTPERKRSVMNAPFSDLRREPNLFHQTRTVSWRH